MTIADLTGGFPHPRPDFEHPIGGIQDADRLASRSRIGSDLRNCSSNVYAHRKSPSNPAI